jgi:hypothetical protein
MADLETRVTALEREVGALKERQAATDADVQNLPELVKLEHKFTNTRIDRLGRDIDDLKIDVERLKDTVEKLPRVVAEIVHEIFEKKASNGRT